mmetsp:Transcript_13637/g.29678  ORF Transcript_13637/g.29678 Transcript_13637/m.29678 type:complete len:587 (+) Transcript_13637:263-2023(+)|eukprot:CAMPEP_0172314000 /NCGR_PEP_ID=MMETSP1058-20130122/21421_1 /TAXON_ID=83371 /ORGANISM="Detonula confervacea, Strain CCMP 353" /LENGTH=586 /DNA_ID=CAMNT_0013027747 /DNA_START=190 /DNA_END=1950 /DNA_ORIENTATION=-
MANSNVDSNGDTCQARSALQDSLSHRQASLTEIERAFLSALLIDKPSTADDEEVHKKKIKIATKVLNDDILFSIPFTEKAPKGEKKGVEKDDATIQMSNHKEAEVKEPLKPPKPTRSNEAQLDLWKAHGDGVRPKQLKEKTKTASLKSISGSLVNKMGSINKSTSTDSNLVQQMRRRTFKKQINKYDDDGDCKQDKNKEEEEEDATSLGVLSHQEVGSINDESTASSWNSSEGGFDHYDTWEVIRDEYAEDFGFKVAVDDENQILPCSVDDEDDGRRGMFKILGTSAEDTRALPHVLSPPLMDSLLNFVPDHLAYSNFWLKFSLTRDGASLDALKRYCRAATHTVLAIETTNGEVFGSFTSTPWRLNNRYFGTGESFLWRMRHSRSTPVHSLFEQAQLESEIDIFPYNGSNDYIQLCTSDKLALGGGATVLKKEESSIQEDEPLDAPAVFLEDSIYGFGLALDENLLHGTTSPSATFGNSNLVNSSGSGETFDVMNLEVWGFTSAQTEKYAEKSEMSMFFVRESISNLSSGATSISSLNADDLSQERFYRRIGENDENESDRDAWQYANMMNPTAGSPYGKMGSPY